MSRQWTPGPALLYERRGAAYAALAANEFWVLSSVTSDGAAQSEVLRNGAFTRGT